MFSSTRCASRSTESGIQKSAPSTHVPVKRFYRNQPRISQKITLTFQPIAEELLLNDKETWLRKILIAARIITVAELNTAQKLANLNSTSLASILPTLFSTSSSLSVGLASLAAKVYNETLSFHEAVIASHHLFIAGASIGDALLLVGKPQAFSVIDFLIDAGVLGDADSELFTASIKFITKNLLDKSVIDEPALRVATRLRYLVSLGNLTPETAIENFRLYRSQKCEPEEFEPFKIVC